MSSQNNNILTLETKVLKNLNLFLLFSTLIFLLFYKNWVLHIEGRGFDNENEIFFGIIEFLGYKSCPWYEINILIASSIYIIFLFVVFIARTFFKQNYWSNLSYLFFILSILSTFAMLLFNFEKELNIHELRMDIMLRHLGVPKPQLSIDMNTICLATFCYSISISILSFLSLTYSLLIISKKQEKNIEDHLVV